VEETGRHKVDVLYEMEHNWKEIANTYPILEAQGMDPVSAKEMTYAGMD